MGHKVHPKIFRTGIIYSWDSKWFAGKGNFASLLREDVTLRKFLLEKLRESAVEKIEIERTPRAITVTIHTAKPGLIIGRGGTGVEDLKKQIRALLLKGKANKKEKLNLNLNVVEVQRPSLSAALVAQSMISDLQRRLPFRRVLKQHLERVQKAGAKGVKVQVGGRLNGAEIARVEKLAWGSVPLHNLRADIDYASSPAQTIAGTIGVKVWIYRGDVFEKEKAQDRRRIEAVAPAAPEPKA
jgi:small subunit ribosomal protein S3